MSKATICFVAFLFAVASAMVARVEAQERPTALLHQLSLLKPNSPSIGQVTGATGTCVTQTIACNQTVTGNLTSSDCLLDDGTNIDFWSFQGQSGQTVTIDLSSTAFDSFLFLLDPVPTVRAADDDSGPGLDSRIVFPLNLTGTWTIGANSFVPDSGSYSLHLQCTGGSTATCTPSATALCLNQGRFRVEATFQTPQGQSGQAQAVGLTEDTGYLWFFSATNVELVVKVLNACSFTSRYWVFAGGLTNVRTVITVTDTQTNAVKTYTNPQGIAFLPIQDVNAFATCP